MVSSSTSIVTVAQRQLTHDLLVCLLAQVPEGHEDSERLSAVYHVRKTEKGGGDKSCLQGFGGEA